MQGFAAINGKGLEVVVTLGTGFGSAVFENGRLCPHLEISHQPFRNGETYDEQLGDVARKDIGAKRWNRRVERAIANMRDLFFFDHLYIGGGNAKKLTLDLPDDVSLVDNTAGVLGGIGLWDGFRTTEAPAADRGDTPAPRLACLERNPGYHPIARRCGRSPQIALQFVTGTHSNGVKRAVRRRTTRSVGVAILLRRGRRQRRGQTGRGGACRSIAHPPARPRGDRRRGEPLRGGRPGQSGSAVHQQPGVGRGQFHPGVRGVSPQPAKLRRVVLRWQSGRH